MRYFVPFTTTFLTGAVNVEDVAPMEAEGVPE